ncbi:MAG: hypothetical protein KIT27_03240 [Legionellales bacterium]|nr:hypothetical protein [Legionellales bacterium]
METSYRKLSDTENDNGSSSGVSGKIINVDAEDITEINTDTGKKSPKASLKYKVLRALFIAANLLEFVYSAFVVQQLWEQIDDYELAESITVPLKAIAFLLAMGNLYCDLLALDPATEAADLASAEPSDDVKTRDIALKWFLVLGPGGFSHVFGAGADAIAIKRLLPDSTIGKAFALALGIPATLLGVTYYTTMTLRTVADHIKAIRKFFEEKRGFKGQYFDEVMLRLHHGMRAFLANPAYRAISFFAIAAILENVVLDREVDDISVLSICISAGIGQGIYTLFSRALKLFNNTVKNFQIYYQLETLLNNAYSIKSQENDNQITELNLVLTADLTAFFDDLGLKNNQEIIQAFNNLTKEQLRQEKLELSYALHGSEIDRFAWLMNFVLALIRAVPVGIILHQNIPVSRQNEPTKHYAVGTSSATLFAASVYAAYMARKYSIAVPSFKRITQLKPEQIEVLTKIAAAQVQPLDSSSSSPTTEVSTFAPAAQNKVTFTDLQKAQQQNLHLTKINNCANGLAFAARWFVFNGFIKTLAHLFELHNIATIDKPTQICLAVWWGLETNFADRAQYSQWIDTTVSRIMTSIKIENSLHDTENKLRLKLKNLYHAYLKDATQFDETEIQPAQKKLHAGVSTGS